MKREDFIPECSMRIATTLTTKANTNEEGWEEKVSRSAFKVALTLADLFKGPGICPPEEIECKNIGLSVRARNVLAEQGVKNIGQLIKYTADEVFNFRNAGRKTVDEIEEKLALYGLTLKNPYK